MSCTVGCLGWILEKNLSAERVLKHCNRPHVATIESPILELKDTEVHFSSRLVTLDNLKGLFQQKWFHDSLAISSDLGVASETTTEL